MKTFSVFLLLPLFAFGFNIMDILPAGSQGEINLKYRVFYKGENNYSYDFVLSVSPDKDGRTISLKDNNKEVLRAKLDKEGKPEILYVEKNRGITINAFQEDGYKKVREGWENITIGKRIYNTIVKEYVKSGENKVEKNNLILITTVESKKNIYQDENGVIVKVEITKYILQKTFNKMLSEKPIMTRDYQIQEVVELVD